MNRDKILKESVDAIMAALDRSNADKKAFLDVLMKANAKLEASMLKDLEDSLEDEETLYEDA